MTDVKADHPIALRYAAFAATAGGGNPAGIVLDARALSPVAMQAIAAEIGYAETAFITEHRINGDARHLRIRFYSPIAEVPFCGHATIATSVALAEREGTGAFEFETSVGPITIDTRTDGDHIIAAFTSVEPAVAPLEDDAEAELLSILGLTSDDLDPRYELLEAYAGNWHPVVVVHDRTTYDMLTFDPDALRSLMDANNWRGTVSVLYPTTPLSFDARNLFPVGAITEDPATGSAAASLGGYLRATQMISAPARIEVHQGSHVGRPSLLTVDIPLTGGIIVSGMATEIA